MPLPEEVIVHCGDVRPSIHSGSLAELDAVLDRLHHEFTGHAPPLAVSVQVFEDMIDFGLGTDSTFLCIQIAPCDGEYYLAVGADVLGEARMFYGSGQDSYWAPRNLIAMEAAREAVRHYAVHQERLASIPWEDWNGKGI